MSIAKQRANKAFTLYQCVVAWNVHQDPSNPYDAWEFNFRTKMNEAEFNSAFTSTCLKQGTRANCLFRAVATLDKFDIPVEEYRDYVVVTSGEHLDYKGLYSQSNINKYREWKRRVGLSYPKEVPEDHLEGKGMAFGIPKVLGLNYGDPIETARSLEAFGLWERVWSNKPSEGDDSMFMMAWRNVHMYRGLYKNDFMGAAANAIKKNERSQTEQSSD